MAQLARVTQKIFGETAGFQEISQFGSLKAGAPAFSTNLTTIQALANYSGGWYDAVLADNAPAIEDMNSLFYLATSQLAYNFQAGIPEWDAGTTYYKGSLIQMPVTVFTITAGNASQGATYTNNGATFTVQYPTAVGIFPDTRLTCYFTGAPQTSGTLTKSGGTGDATITFSAAYVSTGVFVSITDNNTNHAPIVTAWWRPWVPSYGAPNTVMMMDSLGSYTKYDLMRNDNVAADADIVGTKIIPDFTRNIASGYVSTITSSNAVSDRNVLSLVASTAINTATDFITALANVSTPVFKLNQSGGLSLGQELNTVAPTVAGVVVTVNPGQLNVTRDFVVTGSWTSGGALSERIRARSADVLFSGGLVTIPVGANSGVATAARITMAAGNGGIAADSSTGFLMFASNGGNPTSTASANMWLDAQGQMHIRNMTIGTATTVNIDSGTGLMTRVSSSLKYKNGIEDFELDTNVINQLRIITYRDKPQGRIVTKTEQQIVENPETGEMEEITVRLPDEWEMGPQNPRRFLGVIAEEVQEIAPILVNYLDGEPDSVQYDRIACLAVAAIQKLTQRVAALEALLV